VPAQPARPALAGGLAGLGLDHYAPEAPHTQLEILLVDQSASPIAMDDKSNRRCNHIGYLSKTSKDVIHSYIEGKKRIFM
jgi:hypothetical protein